MFSTTAYVLAYACAVLFLLGVLTTIVRYKKNPMHLRWELYPVAHEGDKADYGGSYLEETDWLKKPRHKSLMGELRVMIPEIVFLKAVYESNRTLWPFSLLFHLGLYCTAAFIALLFANAVLGVAGVSTALSGGAWILLLNYLGVCGFILSISGAVGLICRRIFNAELRDSTSLVHYVNLGWFLATSGLALRAWFADGHSFNGLRTFAVNLVRLDIGRPALPHIIAPVILGMALIAYIPWTHMAHFFMKYFLYHDIRWGDEPMTGSEGAEAEIRKVLAYKPTWAANHVHANGRKTWADLATQNPARDRKE